MENCGALRWIAMVLALSAAWNVLAQGPTPGTAGANAPAPGARAGFDVLLGTWIRPDGGYRIVIGGIDASGKLNAVYFNPRELPFAKAQATQDGSTLRASFELRAGGYDGSTYELAYDPASDRLTGVYYQAVVKQKFDVYFVRK